MAPILLFLGTYLRSDTLEKLLIKTKTFLSCSKVSFKFSDCILSAQKGKVQGP
jgi:hypothetical protein